MLLKETYGESNAQGKNISNSITTAENTVLVMEICLKINLGTNRLLYV